MLTSKFLQEVSSILRVPSSWGWLHIGRLVLLLLYCLAYWMGLMWLLT